MRSKIVPITVYAVIFLALFGFGYNMIADPTGLLKNVLMILGFAVLISVAFYFLFMKKRQVAAPSSDMKKYKQAVKQSQQKYKKPAPPASNVIKHKQVSKIKKKTQKKRSSHLRVIEGQKTEKKDRALF